MKKTFLATLAAALLAPALAFAQGACPSLTVTGHPSYPPVSEAKDGTLVGAAPKLVAAIADRMGVKTVTVKDYGGWDKAQAATRSGEADAIFGIYKNDERAKWLDYVDPPFMMDPVSIVVRKGEGFAFAGWDDLKGRKGVTNAGESFGNKFDAFMAASLTVARADGVDKAFAALMDKRADYLIIGLYPGKLEAEKMGLADKVVFLDKPVDSFGMYVGFSKASKCNAMKAEFAELLAKGVESGRVDKLIEDAQKRGHQ
ncbi:MAG: substrate-binding periplasmic protein [Alphaproteobacteria bacterium]